MLAAPPADRHQTDRPAADVAPPARPEPARRRYPSDLTDAQWDRACRVLATGDPRSAAADDADADGPAGRGRPRTVSVREVLNAINYRWRTGCTWRMLPHDFPAWATVYAYYRQWRTGGLLAELRAVLLERETVLEKIMRERGAA